MTVSLCIRHGSKRNDDWVSVEELDWSAERQVLIPAEHLWCDFTCRPWARNSSPNTNDLYIHYMDIYISKRKRHFQTVATKKFMYLKLVFPPLLQQFWSVLNGCTYKSLVFGDEFLAQGLHLKSLQRCSAGIRTWLSLRFVLMEMTKVVKPFIRRGWPNTFGNILYIRGVSSN